MMKNLVMTKKGKNGKIEKVVYSNKDGRLKEDKRELSVFNIIGDPINLDEKLAKQQIARILKRRYGLKGAKDLVNNKDFFTINDVKTKDGKALTVAWYYDSDNIEIIIDMATGEEIEPDSLDI